MSQIPPETENRPGGTGFPLDHWHTPETRLLARISEQLTGIQASLDRIELGAGEFLPWLRGLMGKRTTRAAASAASMFRGGGTRT